MTHGRRRHCSHAAMTFQIQRDSLSPLLLITQIESTFATYLLLRKRWLNSLMLLYMRVMSNLSIRTEYDPQKRAANICPSFCSHGREWNRKHIRVYERGIPMALFTNWLATCYDEWWSRNHRRIGRSTDFANLIFDHCAIMRTSLHHLHINDNAF